VLVAPQTSNIPLYALSIHCQGTTVVTPALFSGAAALANQRSQAATQHPLPLPCPHMTKSKLLYRRLYMVDVGEGDRSMLLLIRGCT
jgi:hypothetical protein